MVSEGFPEVFCRAAIRGHGNLKGLVAMAFALAATGVARAGPQYYYAGGPVTSLCSFGTTVNVNGTDVNGYTHLEGPIDDGHGGILFCELNGSDASKDLIWRWTIGAIPGSSPALVVSNSGGTQGMFNYGTDTVVTADRDNRQISTRTAFPTSNLPSASLVVKSWVAPDSQTHYFYGPNDLVVDKNNGIYFTDPNFTNKSGVYNNRDGVYYISSGTVTQYLDCGSKRPNGIVLSPDGNTLFVGMWVNNNIDSGYVEAYSVGTTGGLTYLRTPITGISQPDGMTTDPWAVVSGYNLNSDNWL
jgi:gluconolactonase